MFTALLLASVYVSHPSDLVEINNVEVSNVEISNVEETLVTATMREEAIQMLPLAISVHDDERLKTLKISTLEDIEYSVPSINFGRGGRNTRGEISIRGVGDYSRNIGYDARVAVYLDGIATGRSNSFDQDLSGVERIEILRGPQGTLFGKNTVSGAINIVTKKPTNTYQTQLQSDIGNFDLRKYSVTSNIPVSDTFFANIHYSALDQSGFIKNTFLNRDLNGNDRKSGHIKFRYLIDDIDVNVHFRGLDEESYSTNAEALEGGPFDAFALTPNEREVKHNAAEFQKRSMYSGSINTDFDLQNDYHLIHLASYRKNKASELNEEDYSTLDVAVSFNDEQTRQHTQELRLVSPKWKHQDYVLGLYYAKQNISSIRGANGGLNFLIPNSSLDIPAEVDIESLSAYAHGRFSLTEKLSIDSGIRYLYEEKSIIYNSFDTTGLFINVTDIRDSLENHQFLPKLGVNFQIDKNTLFYSSLSKGFKSGGWNADSITTLENFKFDQENVISYEAGVKTIQLDKKLTINLATYTAKFNSFQVFQFVPTADNGTVLSLTNASDVTSSGVEIDSNYAFNDDLNLTANIAYTRAKFDSFKNGGGIGVDYDGNDLPYAPRWSYLVSLDHSKKVTNNIALNTNINYSYNTKQFSNPNNLSDNTVPSRHTFNMSTKLSLESQWHIQLWVKNLTDETDLRQKTISFLGQPRGYYFPPRTYGLSIMYTLK